MIEGVEVFKELAVSTASSPSGVPPDAPSPEMLAQHSHIDFVMDISLVPYKNQQFIASASRDGVLKLWK